MSQSGKEEKPQAMQPAVDKDVPPVDNIISGSGMVKNMKILKGSSARSSGMNIILIGLVSLFVVGVLVYSYHKGNQMVAVYSPLVDATMEIKLETTTGHMILEEIFRGKKDVSPEEVVQHFDQAKWYANAMLNGDSNDEGTFIPLEDPKLRAKIEEVVREIETVTMESRKHLEKFAIDPSVGTNTRELHTIFEELVESSDQVETRLQELMNEGLENFRAVMKLMIGLCILLSFVVGFLIYRYDTRTKNFVGQLQDASAEQEKQAWFREGQAGLDSEMRGFEIIEDLCQKVISYFARFLEIHVGAIYIRNDKGLYKLTASYAYNKRKNLANEIEIGNGLVGQAAYEKQPILITNVPDDYITVSSGLGERQPDVIQVVPLIYNDEVIGVMEIGLFGGLSENKRMFIEQAGSSIAIAINMALSSQKTQDALEKSQQLTEELQTQQEELQVANEELEEQTQRLQASEEQLRTQQEELQASNEELEEKTFSLEEQSMEVQRKNSELQNAQKDLERKASELEVTSRYKSDFLANMSHELRTPLNSLLILAQDLAANQKGNLDEEQVESALIVQNSGKDLLNLINEILDLSKIEAGKISVNSAEIPIVDISERIVRNFSHLLEDAGLGFTIETDEGLPETITTDPHRMDQILKNLISNAMKFTEKGEVKVRFHKPAQNTNLSRSGLKHSNTFAVSVTDTGIGIPDDKLKEIFEAFQQLDGSVSRKYGGTGLGLSISRELAKLLGGEIQVESVLGKGTTFILYLPYEHESIPTQKYSEPERESVLEDSQRTKVYRPSPSIDDDRENIKEGDRMILVVEDDLKFAKILSGLCHDRGFKCIHAGDGESGLNLVDTFSPDAIILDIKLPGIQGWQVLETLKNKKSTRHIPVHVMSVEDGTLEAMRKGAIGFVNKPAGRDELDHAFAKIDDMMSGNIRKLLIVEDDPDQVNAIKKLIDSDDVDLVSAGTGKDGLYILANDKIDCMILDLQLPDMTGFELLSVLDEMDGITVPPIIIYTGAEISKEQEEELRRFATSIIIKGVRSPERLLDETALFLHRVVDKMPEHKQKMIAALHDSETLFDSKKILVVDDDMRNVYALTKVLSDKGVEVLKAANGQMAIDTLEQDEEIDLVLMDIMMPVMDGYEAMRRIRKNLAFNDLPILALTAKAMTEDREKCIAAGANDYISKPVDVERLLSMLRVWLYR